MKTPKWGCEKGLHSCYTSFSPSLSSTHLLQHILQQIEHEVQIELSAPAHREQIAEEVRQQIDAMTGDDDRGVDLQADGQDDG